MNPSQPKLKQPRISKLKDVLGSGEFQGFANIVRIKEECWNFLWGFISGGT